MSWTPSEFRNYEMRRQQPASEGDQELQRSSNARENSLHDQIIEHCDKQWPRWKFIHARMDQRSTIEVGAQDFTIFTPRGVLCIECKRVGAKRSLKQNEWAFEMKKLGYHVHLIYRFEEFLNLIHRHENPPPNNSDPPPS